MTCTMHILENLKIMDFGAVNRIKLDQAYYCMCRIGNVDVSHLDIPFAIKCLIICEVKMFVCLMGCNLLGCTTRTTGASSEIKMHLFYHPCHLDRMSNPFFYKIETDAEN